MIITRTLDFIPEISWIKQAAEYIRGKQYISWRKVKRISREWIAHGGSWALIALRQYVKQSEFPAFTRFNVFLRDRFQCQYCGARGNLTFDHVTPRRLGGKTSWENIVTACAPCNMKKGGRTPKQAGMRVGMRPIRPTSWQLQQYGKKFPPHYLHETWRDWLYWDIELEE